ncbi:hypothetical protein NBRC110019_20310 [Neptunitalea chrysea]|uniref:Uncharacterized protein n=1 Tax=Neptunitalea chrysea TaxID=1647581 RepID=A0A9W6B5N7_9FLAO|nr:hypothetical protein [Neptunitalea chrysea]GLB52991.1 hypothetical protein NBRC110019_20310 [Neptunitalea chrysea]
MTQKPVTISLKQWALATLMLIALLCTQNATAQRKKVGSWKLAQHTTSSDSLTIKGAMFTKGVLGWKKVNEPVQVQVYSGKLLIASDLFIENPGTFNLRVNIKNIETSTIQVTFRAEHFAQIEITSLLPKDSDLEIYTEKISFRESRGYPVRNY